MDRPVITASECRKHLKESAGVESRVTETMVARVDAAVRRALKAKATSAIVTIPSYVFGLPDFDIDQVQKSVKAIFLNNGFRVKPCTGSDYTFEVDWAEHDTVRPAPIQVPRKESLFFDSGMTYEDTPTSMPKTRSIQILPPGSVPVVQPENVKTDSKTVTLS